MRRSVLTSAAVAVIACATGAGARPATAASRQHPRIVVTPRDAMIDHRLSVKGLGFPADSRIGLAECGARLWIAPKDPCAAGGVVVRTNADGRFVTHMTARLCPQPSPPTRPEVTCYIGQPVGQDVDVIVLRAAVKVIVSSP